MTRPLIAYEPLVAWKGLEAFYQAFEAQGYAAHRCDIDLVREMDATPEWRDSLMTYWDELARETLSSGRIWQFRGEHRHLPGFYCSSYLDRLEASLSPNTTSGDTPRAIHPLVAAHDAAKATALRGGPSPQAPKYFDPQARMKVAEYNRMGLSAIDWDGKAKAFAAIFSEKAEAAGFERGKPAGRFGDYISRLWFYRRGFDGSLLCVGYQGFGPRGLPRHLPFEFWLASDDRSDDMQFLNLRSVIPGLWNYLSFNRILYPMAYYNNAEEMAKCATIGIQAVVIAYGLLIDSLSEKA